MTLVFLKTLLVFDIILLVLDGLYLYCMKARHIPRGGFYGKLGDYHYAHRGLHVIQSGIPENSIRAFRVAANNGYGAELDVRLSYDGRLVVMHDESLKRTTGVHADVSTVTDQVLNQLTLERTREKVPFLEDVLPLFSGKTPMLIELKPEKGNYKKLTETTMELLRQHPELDYMIESFDPRVLYLLRKKYPSVVRGQLSENYFKDPDSTLSPIIKFILSNLLTNFLTRPDFLAYKYEDRYDLAPCLCRRIWKPQFFWWVVRSQAEANELIQQGDFVIFEGFPAKQRKTE
ncbi:MAG: glycerophosphodiester phosphodiesterase [Oscillospiraceae bacterium]|nr:glycerophosphodiester phosphodiesterase [Oscillospiraceae bacterium]